MLHQRDDLPALLAGSRHDRCQTALLALVMGTTAPAAVLEGFRLALPYSSEPAGHVFLAGAVAGGLGHALLQRRFPLLPTLEHELTHLLVAVLLFRPAVELRAGRHTGHFLFGAGLGTPLIQLTPYVLPTVPLGVLGVALVAGRAEELAWIGVVAAAWGYQLYRAAADARPHQPDLRAGGLWWSGLAVLGGGAWAFVGTALLALGGVPALERWCRAVGGWVG